MKREDKDLLFKDLCGRIMYGVKCTVYEDTSVHTLSGVLPNCVYKELYFRELDWKECDGFADVQYCKPYLFPMSCMTEEQKLELATIKTYVSLNKNKEYLLFDWLNANHFDYRNLIDKKLAIDCTNLNIY